jgi:hypothetical protein
LHNKSARFCKNGSENREEEGDLSTRTNKLICPLYVEVEGRIFPHFLKKRVSLSSFFLFHVHTGQLVLCEICRLQEDGIKNNAKMDVKGSGFATVSVHIRKVLLKKILKILSR